jgi:hypothetical protein
MRFKRKKAAAREEKVALFVPGKGRELFRCALLIIKGSGFQARDIKPKMDDMLFIHSLTRSISFLHVLTGPGSTVTSTLFTSGHYFYFSSDDGPPISVDHS